MKKPAEHDKSNLRLMQQRNALGLRLAERVTATKDRVTSTRRMIAQSKTLLGKAREALESSRVLRQTETPRLVPEPKP